MLPNVTFIKNKSGLGRKLAGTDHISGLLFYVASLAHASGFTGNVEKIYSPDEAETLGVTAGAYPIERYHVDEFFRLNSQGTLHIGLYVSSGATHTFSEVVSMQREAEGEIKQLGVYSTNDFSTAQVSALQQKIDDLDDEATPLVGVLAMNHVGTALNDLADLSTLNCSSVGVLIGQDEGATGGQLFATKNKSISALGALIGTLSTAKVSESIGWIGQFKPSGVELDTVAFSNGTSLKTTSLAQQNDLASKRYIFLHKQPNISGKYFNGDNTCATNDLDSIKKVRTINKAIANCRTTLTPRLNAPVEFNADGSIDEVTIDLFKGLCDVALEDMRKNRELSNYAVSIDPAQDVMGSDTLEITLELQPIGVSSFIKVNVGFVRSIA